MSVAVGELSLRDYLLLLRRRKWVIVLAVLVVAVTALGSAMLQTPTYEASASVQVTNNPTPGLQVITGQSVGQLNDPDRFVADQAQVIRGAAVQQLVARRVGLGPTVTVQPVPNSNTIRITATSTRPLDAATAANAYAEAYLVVSQQQNQGGFTTSIFSLSLKIEQLNAQINDLTSRIVGNPDSAANQSIIQQRNTVSANRVTYQSQLDNLVQAQASTTASGWVTAYATKPATPVAPRPVNSAVVGAAVGLALGLTAAFILERLDDSVKSNHDLEAVSGGLPTLGIIPFESVPRTEPLYVAARDHTNSPAAEAYRSLRTSIRLLCLDQSLRVLQVTSSSQGEGKSTTIANLGVALAQAGVRTTIVCSDFRRPKLHNYFGLSNDVGFSSALVGDVPLSEAVQAVPGQENLYLLASGPRPGNPSELLSGRRVQKIFEALRLASDVVLVDAPPVLPVTDASILGRMVDGTLVVARAGITSSKDLRRTLEVLRQVKVPLVGTVLNATGRGTTYGYATGYGYGYGYGYHYADTGATPAPPPPEVKVESAVNGRAPGAAGNGAADSETFADRGAFR